jgi:hypothetical protein
MYANILQAIGLDMATNLFYNIIHKQNSISNELYNCSLNNIDLFYENAFRHELKNDHNIIKLLNYIFITTFKNTFLTNAKSKFIYLESILHNPLLNDTSKEEFLSTLCQSQRTYFVLNRFVRNYKMKKMKPIVSTDLYMNPIEEKQKNVITIYQNEQKYLFTLYDILNIVNRALCHCDSFVPEPMIPKNPYNNLPFSNANLYAIYFFVSERCIRSPILMSRFFEDNFNIRSFLKRNEFLIQKIYFKMYFKTMNNDIIQIYMNRLLKDNIIHEVNRLKIDDQFPKENLYSIMKPYVELFIIYSNSIDDIRRKTILRLLKFLLYKFYNFNPNFGRKIYNIKYGKISGFTFNDNHIEYSDNVNIKEIDRYIFSYNNKNHLLVENDDDSEEDETYGSSYSDNDDDDDIIES